MCLLNESAPSGEGHVWDSDEVVFIDTRVALAKARLF